MIYRRKMENNNDGAPIKTTFWLFTGITHNGLDCVEQFHAADGG